MLGGTRIAAFMPQAYDDGIQFWNGKDILPENSSHVRDFHALVSQVPELEAVAVVRFIVLFEYQISVGSRSFFYIGFGNELFSVPVPFV